ncbi:MAG: outer membrane protein assembly factor BamC, partial [Gammaproteobacteria bacterium]|nr:outer membrane protein assembly factor BamC [Gammaproteobacteria bacterium]
MVAVLGTALAACGSIPKLDEVVKDRSAEYKSSSSLPPLEVPPDLSSSSIDETMVVPDVGPASGTATYSEYSGERPEGKTRKTQVLIDPEGIEIKRDEDKRWLVLDGPASRYWNRVREFWLENGLLLKVENPSIGIMETDWAENRADIPQGLIRNWIGKLMDSLYSAATRDKYRVRFERGMREGTTELYLSHRGAEEIAKGDETTIWQPRPSDPELEVEMLNRLVVFLGVREEKAKRMIDSKANREPRAHLTRDSRGRVSLDIKDDFSRAWRRTGLALDRVGFTVEDRDRSRGLYFVRYVDPLQDEKQDEGILSSLKFWGDDEKKKPIEYLISLIGDADSTQVVILNKQ